eukprot:1012532-Rhodomonas_salina.3
MSAPLWCDSQRARKNASTVCGICEWGGYLKLNSGKKDLTARQTAPRPTFDSAIAPSSAKLSPPPQLTTLITSLPPVYGLTPKIGLKFRTVSMEFLSWYKTICNR